MVKTILYYTVLVSIFTSEDFYLNSNGMKDERKREKK